MFLCEWEGRAQAQVAKGWRRYKLWTGEEPGPDSTIPQRELDKVSQTLAASRRVGDSGFTVDRWKP